MIILIFTKEKRWLCQNKTASYNALLGVLGFLCRLPKPRHYTHAFACTTVRGKEAIEDVVTPTFMHEIMTSHMLASIQQRAKKCCQLRA